MMRRVFFFAASAALLLTAQSASASVTLLGGVGDPASVVTGGSQITFTGQGPVTAPSYTTGGVTFTANGGTILVVDNAYDGQLNNYGVSLHGHYDDGFEDISLSFAAPIQAFAFNWGAADTGWLLAVYDAGHNLLGSSAVAPTGYTNFGTFVGLASNKVNISSAHLYADQANYHTTHPDYVFIDNFTTGGVASLLHDDPPPEGGGGSGGPGGDCHAKVCGPPGGPPVGGGIPEPSVWAMLIAGFGLTGTALRRRTRAARA